MEKAHDFMAFFKRDPYYAFPLNQFQEKNKIKLTEI